MKIWVRIIVAILAVAGGTLVWAIYERTKQREWPGVQAQRCHTLSTSLAQYHQQEGIYPKSLQDLVSAGILTEKEYQDLQFQTHSRAEPQAWFYYQPSTSNQTALLSKEPIIRWKGHAGVYVTGRGGGATEIFGANKLSSYLRDIKARGL